LNSFPPSSLAVAMPPRRRKTLSSPSSTVDSIPLSTTEQSLRSTPATSEADSEKPAPRRLTRSGAPKKGPKKRVRESSDEEDPLAVEEDEEEPIQKVAKRATKRRAITNHAYVEIVVKKKPPVCFIAPCLPGEKFGASVLTDTTQVPAPPTLRTWPIGRNNWYVTLSCR
jgi:hypothetical protein